MIVIPFNKNAVLLISSLALLIGAVLWREIGNKSGNIQTIVIDNLPETTTSVLTSATMTPKTVISKSTIITSQKSTYCTKTTEITTVISEITTKTADLYVDINTADYEELIQLNGIGDYLAGQIIAYREENGSFLNIEEIVNVSGIGNNIFESIRDFIYVENPVYYQPTEENFIAEEPEMPIIEEITVQETTTFLTLEDCVPVNLNEASIDLLVLLPYVDEEIAREIIELRENLGKFSHVYELLYVESLSDEQIREIIEYVCV